MWPYAGCLTEGERERERERERGERNELNFLCQHQPLGIVLFDFGPIRAGSIRAEKINSFVLVESKLRAAQLCRVSSNAKQ